MANRQQILDKIKRNMEQLNITVDVDTQSATTSNRYLQAGNITIHYTDAVIASPQGGIDDSTSPFLGIGIANPGKIVIAGLVDADVAITDILVTEEDLQIMRICSGMANDIEVKAGRTDLSVLSASLAEVSGSSDLQGMGQ